ncbi:MAG: hypothetical protein E6J43_08135 [Chloroflexi bacterium]|nr:MAG: hypothetical protein E6J43_08135 [Chloroflexota bacterium]
MSRDNSSDALANAIVGLILTVLAALFVAIVVHYFSRGRDWWLYVTDDPGLYALTDTEHAWFTASAWAFPLESACVAAAIAVVAVGLIAGFAIGVATFGCLAALTVWLLSNENADPRSQRQGDELYDLGGFDDADLE